MIISMGNLRVDTRPNTLDPIDHIHFKIPSPLGEHTQLSFLV